VLIRKIGDVYVSFWRNMILYSLGIVQVVVNLI